MAARYLNSGRNASSGYKRDRKQTIPGRKWSESAKTGEEASKRARTKRENQKTPSVPKVEKKESKSIPSVKSNSQAINEINAYRDSLRKNTRAVTPEETMKRNSFKRYQGQSISNSKPMSQADKELTNQLKSAFEANRVKENARKAYGTLESALAGAGQALTAPASGVSKIIDKVAGRDVFKDDNITRNAENRAALARQAHGGAYGAGTLAGMMLGSYALGGGSVGTGGNSAAEAYNTAKEASMAMNGLSKQQAAIQGLKSAAKTLGVNTIKELPKDLVMDTLPRIAEVVDDPTMTNSDRVKAVAENIMVNAAMNNLSEIPGLVGIGKDASRTIKGIPTDQVEIPKLTNAGAKPNRIINKASNLIDELFNFVDADEVANSADNVIPKLTNVEMKANRFNGQPTIISQLGDSAPVNTLDNATKSIETPVTNPDDVVYHSGILSRLNKADSAGKMEGTRDTGYFGTGHYFVDNAHKGEISTGSYGEKPFSSVDISQYGNLYKANTNAKADKLHDFSQRMMRYVNGHNDKYYVENGEIIPESLNEYMDTMYKEYKDLFGNKAMSKEAFESRLNDFRTGYNFDATNRGDSAFTTFMKEHGYNGVDTRGTSSANTERGIVIYDLDENSVLQSNVTDAAAKSGPMNTRVRNGNPVFDQETDANIQKEIDAYNNRMRIQQEYHKIYDDTNLNNAANTLESLKSRADNIENNAIPHYRYLLENDKYLQREVNDQYNLYSSLGLAETKENIRSRVLNETQSELTKQTSELEELKKAIKEAQKAYDAELKISNSAYKQAESNIRGVKTGYDSARREFDNLFNGYTDVAKAGGVTDSDWRDIINSTSEITAKYGDDPDYRNITDLASQKLDDFNKMVQSYKNAPKVEAPRVDNALRNVDNGYEWVDPDRGVSVKETLDSLRSDLDNVPQDIHPTTRKNVDYLKGSIDRLESAYKSGENFNEAYEDYRKALNRVNDNMAKKEGNISWKVNNRTLLNPDNPDNIANRFKRLSSADNFDDANLPFNDDYKNLPDADGLGHRQGVNIDIRNMDDGVSRDRLIAEQRISKVRSNTLENAGLDNAEELKNVIPEEDFSYISQPEQVTYEAAISQLDNDWNGSVARYTADYNKDTISDIRSAQDVDAMMLAHQRLNEAARNATDPVEKARLYEESRKIALNLRKAGTGAGQQIQAFAKWTRTPEGAVTSAQGFAEEMVENGLKGNPKMANEIKDVTNEISSFLDEMDESAMTRQEIEDMIRDAISRRAQLRKRVTNGDIHKIADAILNDRQYADIQKELEYLATGYEDVDAETLEQVQDIFERAYDLDFNSKERVDLENEAYKLLANKIVPNGGSFRDKLDAWRYLAMLANPTTHIKNITGNELFGQGMVSAKNAMAALLEEGADRVSKATGGNGIERTKAILTTADKDLIDAANNDALQNAYRELSGNKYYSTGEGIDKAIQPFSNKKLTGRALNKAAEFNTNLLNAEDEMAVIAKYRTSLAGFLKANGADASIFNATDNASKSLLESGRQYAINQAKEAAFHQDSAVASWLSGISRTARESNSNTVKALGFAGDIVVPFKKTPINILKSAIEYSPAEYIKVATDIPKLNKGIMKPAEFIDDISKATTGTAALGIGALLAHEGILKIGSSKSDEEQAFDKNTGRQNVAIKAGNKYVGMSELIPAAAPLILGATIFETMADSKGDENALNTIFSGMSAVANGVTDMTMLSGIADTLNSIRFAKDKSEVWQKLGIDTMSNLASQMLPTLGRKIETTIDDTKRSTYSDQTGALKTIDQELKYLQTKIPGLQQAGEALQGSSVPFLQAAGNRLALEPNIDVKGQVQNSPGVGGMDNAFGRVINNFISPVPITEDQSTVYDDERRRLAEATGETAVLPYIASKEATIDDIQLTPEEWTQYRQARGQMREDVATNMIDSDFYKNASDADKVKLLTDIDTFTKNYSQSKYGKALSGPDQKLAEIYEKEGAQGLIKNFIGKDIAASVDLSSNSKVAERIQSAVNNNDLKTAQAIASDTGIITGAGLTPSVADAYQDAKQRIPSLTANNYVAMFKKVDKDGNGSLKQDEIIDAMNRDKKNASTYEKAFWTSDSKKPQKVDGQYKATSTKSGKSKGKTEGKSAKENNKDRIKELNGGGDIQSQLASYGAIDSETTVKYYNHAKQTIPSLTPKGYAQKLHEIGGDDYKITQKEMLSYANDKGLSEDDMSKYWNAYGQWKRIPYLSGGTWKAK